jgi:hypothetical protein
MSHGHHPQINPADLEKRFEFDAPARRWVFTFIGVGLLLFVLGLVLAISNEGSHRAGGHGDHGHSSVIESGQSPFVLTQHAEPATDTAAPNSAAQPEGTAHTEDAAAHGTDHAAHGEAHTGSAAGAHHDTAHAADHAGPHVHEPLWLTRLFSNLLIFGFLFTGVGVLSVFLIAINYASNAGWYVQLQRVMEAMAHFIPIGGAILLLTFIAGSHHLYHWTDAATVANDPLLQGKAPYLNAPFFLIRNVVFLAVWMLFFILLRNSSRKEDLVGGIAGFNKRIVLAGGFIIVFGLTFSAASWDWIMSVEAHWFSTMFSVRMFSTCLVTAVAILFLFTLYLKNRGYLPYVNASHFHDLGKFMFAFSIFWTYIWFCEFLLIWYANIPEEGLYFYKRLHEYPVTFFSLVAVNFIIPFFILLSRANMRHTPTMAFVAFVIIFGHGLDVFLAVMPGTMQEFGSYGIMELGAHILFMGLFMLVTASVLGNAAIVPKNHPYIKESLYHQY